MVKTFLKIKKFISLPPKRIRGKRAERRKLHKRKSQKREKFSKIKENVAFKIPDLENSLEEDILSKYSKDRIEFLFSEGNNVINEYLSKEIEEFIPFSKEQIPPSLKEKRYFIIYSMFDLINKINALSDYKFPENFLHSVIALFDYFLSKSKKEMKLSYMWRTMYACADIIDKEEGLGVFINEQFQKNFTTNDEIDVLEAIDFIIYPIKPFDYFSHFCFNAHVLKRNDLNFLNYLEKLKEKFDEIAFYLLINEETKINKPSTNYLSMFIIAYEETKNDLPLGDNFINNYINNFKSKINYQVENYSIALEQLEKSYSLVEEAKFKYLEFSEQENDINEIII